MCVPLCVLFSEIRIKWLHTVTEGDTQILTKANTCNKTGDLDITSDLPLTPETRVQVPVGPPDKFKGLSIHGSPFFVCVSLFSKSGWNACTRLESDTQILVIANTCIKTGDGDIS